MKSLSIHFHFSGDIKITQSNAILRYLGRKFALDGRSEQDRVRVDMMLDNAMDFRNGFIMLSYNPKFNQLKDDYITKLEPTLEKFSKFLANRKFFSAEYLTYPDFHMYEMLYSHKQLAPRVVEKFRNLVDFIDRMENLPRVSAFLKSNRSPKPMNNKMAAFGKL